MVLNERALPKPEKLKPKDYYNAKGKYETILLRPLNLLENVFDKRWNVYKISLNHIPKLVIHFIWLNQFL